MTDKTLQYKLGDKVLFIHPLRRKSEIRKGTLAGLTYSGWSLTADKTWEPWVWWNLETPVEGLIVGKRVIYDGTVEYGYEDNPTTFTPTKSHTVYQIAYNLRLATVYVRPEDITLLEGVPE